MVRHESVIGRNRVYVAREESRESPFEMVFMLIVNSLKSEPAILK